MPTHWWQRLPKHRADALSARVLAVVKSVAARLCREPGVKSWLELAMPLNGDVETTLYSGIIQTAFQLAILYHVQTPGSGSGSGSGSNTLVVGVTARPPLPLYADDGHTGLFGARGAKLLLPYVVSVLHTYAPVKCASCILAPLLALARLEKLPGEMKIEKLETKIQTNNAAAVSRLAQYFDAEAKRLVPKLHGPPTTRVRDIVHYCEIETMEDLAAKGSLGTGTDVGHFGSWVDFYSPGARSRKRLLDAK
jgi:hypothetical protein